MTLLKVDKKSRGQAGGGCGMAAAAAADGRRRGKGGKAQAFDCFALDSSKLAFSSRCCVYELSSPGLWRR